MAKLIVLGDKAPIREYELQATNTLGRHPSQTIQILDRLVSKEHAIIEVAESGGIIHDLGSRNGTFVNNRLVNGQIELNHGDKLLLGGTRLVFMNPDPTETAGSLTRVTIAPEFVQSAIAAKLPHTESKEFRPENVIEDVRELRGDYEKLRMAFKLQRDISLEVDLSRLLQKIMDSLFESLKCDRGAILLLDEASGELQTQIVKTRRESKEGEEIAISHTIVAQVLEDKAAVLSSDASMDSRFQQAHSIIMQGIRSTMCVPLIAREEVLGVIHVDSLIATGAFTEKDLNVVQGLATQAAMAIENSLLIQQRESDFRLREEFSRLLSPNLVEQVVSGQLEITKGGENRRSTVLFSDLRGFTSMSQRKEPSEVVHLLNEFFEIMVDVVFEFEGTLDKFMGDGFMAVWGSPVEVPDSTLKAVAAAVKMQHALSEFNEMRRGEGLEEMHLGIGIATGELVAGYMGSTKTMNYTVIGPCVNLASRLCSIAKAGQTLVAESTLSEVMERVAWDELEPVQLKGIQEAVIPYSVLELTGPPLEPRDP